MDRLYHHMQNNFLTPPPQISQKHCFYKPIKIIFLISRAFNLLMNPCANIVKLYTCIISINWPKRFYSTLQNIGEIGAETPSQVRFDHPPPQHK